MADAAPGSVRDALEMIMTGYAWLAGADAALVPVAVRADCLRELERVTSVHTAVHASVLSAFDYDLGFQADGQGTSRTWLMWQAQLTPGAASGAVGWMRRLRAHSEVAAALREGAISASWARQICEWTDSLPDTAEQRIWPRLDPAVGPVPDPAAGWPVAAPGEECDAAIVPVVTGCLDPDLLDKLTGLLTGLGRPGDLTPDGTARVALDAGSVRDLIIANAAALFTGPRGLASRLRRATLDGPARVPQPQPADGRLTTDGPRASCAPR